MITAVLGSVGMAGVLFVYWAVATRRVDWDPVVSLSALGFASMLFNGAITGAVFCSIVKNFPMQRGVVVGIAKAWVGQDAHAQAAVLSCQGPPLAGCVGPRPTYQDLRRLDQGKAQMTDMAAAPFSTMSAITLIMRGPPWPYACKTCQTNYDNSGRFRNCPPKVINHW